MKNEKFRTPTPPDTPDISDTACTGDALKKGAITGDEK